MRLKALTEAQKRYLARIARLMMEGSNCDIGIQLRDGGVRQYEESKKFSHETLPVPDERMMAALAEAASRESP